MKERGSVVVLGSSGTERKRRLVDRRAADENEGRPQTRVSASVFLGYFGIRTRTDVSEGLPEGRVSFMSG